MRLKTALAALAGIVVSAAVVAQTVPIPYAQWVDPGNQLGSINALVKQVNTYQSHVLYSIPASVSSGSGTGEQTLGTYSMPGGTLDVAGRHLEIFAAFQTAANTNNKTPKLYFGSEALATAAVATASDGAYLRAVVIKTGASTQNVSFNGVGGTAGVTPVTSMVTGAETDTSAITIKATCTDGSNSAGDCVLADFYVKWIN